MYTLVHQNMYTGVHSFLKGKKKKYLIYDLYTLFIVISSISFLLFITVKMSTTFNLDEIQYHNHSGAINKLRRRFKF
jgi:hypothetical protein